MASMLPAYVLRDFTLVAGNENKVGNVQEITLPVLEKTMEEIRNAGMIKPREVALGLEATRCQFKGTSIDPAAMRLFAGNGPDERIIAYGYLESENGSDHAARFEMTCDFTKIDFGTWKNGEVAMVDFDTAVHTGRFVIDGDEIFKFSDTEWSIGGQVQQPRRARALRLN